MVFDASPSGATHVSVEWVQQSADARGAAEANQYAAQLEEFMAQRTREIREPPEA